MGKDSRGVTCSKDPAGSGVKLVTQCLERYGPCGTWLNHLVNGLLCGGCFLSFSLEKMVARCKGSKAESMRGSGYSFLTVMSFNL